jgi:hypothetical protein
MKNLLKGFKRNRKGVLGLLVVTLVVCMNLILLYLVFSFVTPILGSIGPQLGNTMAGDPNVDAGFLALFYNNGRWTYFDSIGTIFFGIVIAQILVIVLYAARRHDNEVYTPG